MGKTRQLGDIVSNGLVSVATTTDTLNIGTGITFFGTTGIASVTGLYVNGTEITSSGGGGGVSDIVEDTTPQLGGDLHLNTNDITGTGNISITGNLNISGIATVQNKLHLLDSDKIVLGTDDDFDIFHDGSHAYLENKTGDLFIRGGGSGNNEGGNLYIQSKYNQDSIKCVDDAGVTLYHGGNARLDTVSGGITLTGSTTQVTVSSASTDIIINPLSGGDANAGKVIIQGALQVDGETTTINSTTLTIDDKSIVLASGASDSAAANGAGIEVDGASATFQYSHTGTKWISNKTIEATSFIKTTNSGGFLKADGTEDTNTYLTSETSHTDVLVDGDFGSAGFMKRGASAGAYSISATISTSEIADDAVTYAKIQNVSATDRILGRDSAGAGIIEEITPADVRSMLNVEDGANNYSHPDHSGDVTSSADGATTIAVGVVTTAKIADEAVTFAKMQHINQNIILGRDTANAGDVEQLSKSDVLTILNVEDGANAYTHPDHTGEVTSTADGATVIAVGVVTTAKIADDAVTYAKIQDVSATDRILGRDSAGAGVVEEIAPAALRTMINVADGANAYSHPNHTGDVTSLADGATTIADEAVTFAKMQHINQNIILGRSTANAGDVEALSKSDVLTILNVADGATAYSNSDVDSHLNQSNPTSGYVLSWNGSDYAWVAQSGGGGTPGGTNTAVQYNNSGSFAGIATLMSIDATNHHVAIGTAIDIIPYDTQNNGTLSFEGSAGQLFSIENNLSSGSIFSVNDVSGLPSIDVDADGTIQLAPLSSTEYVGIGTTNPQYKLHVIGDVEITGTLTNNGSSVGGGGVSDGDKGDITVSNSGATWTIDSDVVTYDKMQDLVTANRVLGGTAAGTISEVQVQTAMVADDAVTYAKIQNVSATDRLLGRDSAGAGVIEEITPANVRSMLNVADGATAYSNSDVDSHLNQSNPTSGYVLSWNGSDYAWVAQSGGGGISNVVEDTTPQLGGNLDVNGNNIEFGDDDIAIFGASNDLLIYHAVSTTVDHVNETYLTAQNGGLNLEANSSGHVRIKGTYQNGTLAKFNDGGAAELYHDGNKKLETTNGGVTVTGIVTATSFSGSGSNLTDVAKLSGQQLYSSGDLRFAADGGINFGTGYDMYILHYTGGAGNSGNIIRGNNQNLTLDTLTSGDILIKPVGSVELYENGSKKLETTSGGVTVTGIVTATSFVKSGGTSSQYLMADGSTSTGGGGGGISNVVDDTTPQLGGDLDANGKNIVLGDSAGTTDDRITFGAGADLQIYHNGSNSVIQDSGTGDLILASNSTYFYDSANSTPRAAIGQGLFSVRGDGSDSAKISLFCEQNSHSITIKSPLHSNFSNGYTLTLPGSAGSNGQVLTTDGNGNTSWTTVSGGGGGGGVSQAKATAISMVFG